jgi:DNA-binding transcriptional LysR family regulator
MTVKSRTTKFVAPGDALSPAPKHSSDFSPPSRGSIEEIKCLELVVRVAQFGSFTKAAEHVGMSTALASKLITRLESELGAQLFNRSTRAIAVTESGRLFVEKAMAALDQIEEGIDLVREKREVPSGTVTVMISSPIGKEYILAILPEFMARYPEINLEICFRDGGADMIQDGYNIAINDRAIVLLASPDYLSRCGIPKDPEDLLHHDCINTRLFAGHLTTPHSAGGQLFTWALSLRGGNKKHRFVFTPRPRLVIVEQYDGALNAARAGLGIVPGYSQLVLQHLHSGSLKIVLPDYEVGTPDPHVCGYDIRYSHRKYLPKADRVFIDFLLEHFRGSELKNFDPRKYSA